MASKARASIEAQIAAANPSPGFKKEKDKKTWNSTGHSGGGHTGLAFFFLSKFSNTLHRTRWQIQGNCCQGKDYFRVRTTLTNSLCLTVMCVLFQSTSSSSQKLEGSALKKKALGFFVLRHPLSLKAESTNVQQQEEDMAFIHKEPQSVVVVVVVADTGTRGSVVTGKGPPLCTCG
jgi:hypothetical protein